MFDKLFEAKQKAEEAKQKLAHISVSASIENNNIEVVATADKKIQSIRINDDFFAQADKESIEELITVAINKALDKAEDVANKEMAAITQQMMGGLGNLFGQ